MGELQEFNKIWDAKVAEFESHAASLEQQLAARHKNEHADFLEKVRKGDRSKSTSLEPRALEPAPNSGDPGEAKKNMGGC